MSIAIQRVVNLDESWDAIALLYGEFEAYNQAFESRTLASDWQTRLRERLRLNDDRLVLLAYDGATLVGLTVAVVRRNEGLASQTVGYLSFAYVREQYRRHGIGKALVTQAESWCRERGAPRVELDVFYANQAAREFWRNRGFEPVSMTLAKGFQEEDL